MEVWEVAAALGIGFNEPGTSGATSAPKTVEETKAESVSILRARVAAAKGEAPAPQPSATNPADIDAMMSAFNARPG